MNPSASRFVPTWRRPAPLAAVLLLVALAPLPCTAADSPSPAVDPQLFDAMAWRLVGPFRGGRVTAVAGVVQDPLTYYFGATGGGVWKTTDAGVTWTNVSDDFITLGSVGALAVAPSDPNVVYAGMGEAAIRGVATSHGDGVYRSTDAGRTWEHLGLAATEHVSAIAVDPRDPDRVWVAAQGSSWRPNPERGIYRSENGGRSWQLVLHVGDAAGASGLALDPTNPRILYAAFWDHQRLPWQVRSGGPASGVWKTTDGGDSWRELGKTDEDGEPLGAKQRLPELMGKVGVAVSPARPQRVWAMVEAEEGGLFRSDDGGETWNRVNEERLLRARAWYYTHVFAHPTDPETVFVLNAPMLRSTDGGKTFAPVSTPHGDNHALWINPREPRWMINGNDGGANVSANAGDTWSAQSNQPTAQFYRVETDAAFPYRIYGGQQDNSTVAIASAAAGGIGRGDWFSVGGCESAHVAFDPDDPRLVYAGCYQGLISERDVVTGRERGVMAVPYLGIGVDPKDQPYRFNWNAPIEASPHDPRVIYHGGNVLLRSDDRGTTWTEVSPDLTRDEEDKQGPGGAPITNESAGGENYGTLVYVALSPHAAGTIWTGSDDGLVHVTRDGGETWQDVTPPAVAADPPAQVNAIEVSPHAPGVAYVAATRFKYGDYRALAFATADYGATWTALGNGIAAVTPPGSWVHVVREDPERRGLLYAGTETGVVVSFDDGRRWQPLALGEKGKLPPVPVTDLKIRDGDLVAATQGRAFWVLDDLSPLRQAAEAAEAAEVATGGGAPLHLYRPAPAVRVSWGGRGDEGSSGENPPEGAILDYVLSQDLAAEFSDPVKRPGSAPAEPAQALAEETPADPATDSEPDEDRPALTLEIRDPSGTVLRTFTSAEKTADGEKNDERLPAEPGMNRFVWDLRTESVEKVEGFLYFGTLAGPMVPPGAYTVRLAAGEREATRELQVVEDPRIETADAAYAEQQAFLAEIRATVADLHASVKRARAVRTQVEAQITRAEHLPAESKEPIETAGRELSKALEEWVDSVGQTKTANFQDIINYPGRLNAQILFLANAVDGSGPPVGAGARPRYADLAAQWSEARGALDRLLAEDLAAFNELIAADGTPAVVVPATD